eukprot:TRINITY_DN6105_c0_g2_i1.p1 TRINITY_DN6105_c0_g2~~TRINITY_DN6105_c0_g2_i1.p1  ORF type:complete len:884 (-),score=131.28 TRINITY_DN6105_c0_g2_i1:88-2739(-)
MGQCTSCESAHDIIAQCSSCDSDVGKVPDIVDDKDEHAVASFKRCFQEGHPSIGGDKEAAHGDSIGTSGSRRGSSVMQAEHPVSIAGNSLFDYVCFVKVSDVTSIDGLWPRCQEMKKATMQPTEDDLVVAVSHAWRYQTHPDPLNVETGAFKMLIDQAITKNKQPGSTYMFYDFVSVTQRPFRPGQVDRTPEEVAAFSRALLAMPRIFMMADVVLHIDNSSGWGDLPGEGELYSVSMEIMAAVKLAQFGSQLHIVGFAGGAEQPLAVGLMDRVVKIGGKEVHTMAEFDDARSEATPAALVEIERLPFGNRNTIPARDKGWIYLERFCSMVKVAMVDTSSARNVAFSNNEAVVEEIIEGGRRLRQAMKEGNQQLKGVLRSFHDELYSKHFAQTSMDCKANTEAQRSSRQMLSDDATIVASIMQELVNTLSDHWQREVVIQKQRQLVLAVGRGNAALVVEMLQANADPNYANERGGTCLHVAAKRGDIDVVDALIDFGAKCTLQDNTGHTPAHLIPLWARSETVELFKRLACNSEVLKLETNGGVSVYKHFWVWSSTAQAGDPYEPICSLLQEYASESLRKDSQVTMRRASELSVEGQHCKVKQLFKPYVKAWEPMMKDASKVSVVVVVLAMQAGLPWSLQKEAIAHISELLCERFNATLYALTPHNLPEGANIEQFHKDLLAQINDLPLPDKFFLVDNSFGTATAMLWMLSDRLSGAMVINGACVFPEEYIGSEAHQKFSNVMLQRAKERRYERDCETLCKTSVSNFVYGDPEFVSHHRERVLAAAQDAGDEFWNHIATINEWCPQAIRESLMGRQSLHIDVTLACSAHAPMLVIQESMEQLHEHLLPSAAFVHLPESKGWWELDQVDKVLEELIALIERNTVA